MPDQYSKLVGHPLKYPYVAGITTESGDLGTGILISDRFVLTCGHVLDDSPWAEVVFREGTTGARVRKIDESLDLALLELMRPISIPKATFTEIPLRPNAVVLAVGVQETLGKSDELSVAEIELRFRNQNVANGKVLDIQLDGGARPGYSGGPIIVEKGRALLCIGVLRSGGAGANTSNAVGLAPIRAFVADCVPELPEHKVHTNAGVSRRRLLMLAAILFGTFGTIAGWHYLAPSGQNMTAGTANVTKPEAPKAESDKPTPGIKPPVSLTQSHNPNSKDFGNPDVKVWVNTSSHVYHCPGEGRYGKTKHGEYMVQAEAQKKGNRPAYEKVCD